jgi:ribonuclease HII
MAVGLKFERQAAVDGYRFVAGVDEVGRGCLAGAVVAGAVILDLQKPLPRGLNDSKQLTALQRETIAEKLKQRVVCYAVAEVDAEEIDRINILQASKKAMRLAVEKLQPGADFLLVDALQLGDVLLPQKSIIRGDAISASIAAASVIAKTYRDGVMREMHEIYPQYGFNSHVGYGTKIHWMALKEHGHCPLHRKTFKGVIPPTDLLFEL